MFLYLKNCFFVLINLAYLPIVYYFLFRYWIIIQTQQRHVIILLLYGYILFSIDSNGVRKSYTKFTFFECYRLFQTSFPISKSIRTLNVRHSKRSDKRSIIHWPSNTIIYNIIYSIRYRRVVRRKSVYCFRR